ncbi:hypothetical protein WICMUC_003872 [Wickerhamomyces mucosus]|uniref:Uncharacterized protein n=1 Tax=Wickerhamomyces mucosus TaxID=1378264 RepID=A0A9P8PKN2_9ASCO|nr:hypothetical protein WICMUC_003872 [Wickerhamomyces mucosus]
MNQYNKSARTPSQQSSSQSSAYLHEPSALNSSLYTTPAPSSSLSSNSYTYSASTIPTESPLQQPLNLYPSNTYNHLNLSTHLEDTSSPIQNASLYSSSSNQRPITSPSLNFSSLYSTRARFNASKGFDIEDDLEFCPAITYRQPNSNGTPTGHVNPYANYFTSHKFNPYTSTSFSPQSPTYNNSPTQKITNENSPRATTPRTKKIVEANNFRVGSPRLYK